MQHYYLRPIASSTLQYIQTGSQVIVEDLNPYYLKQKKLERPAIKFEKLIKVENNVFKKKKDALFGL